MSATEILKIAVEASTSAAKGEIKSFGAGAKADLGGVEQASGSAKGAITDLGAGAEEGFGKVTTHSGLASGAMSALSDNALPIAAGLVTAAIGIGTEWTNSAIAAGKFADQTGLSVEKASALTNVSNDLGVSTETLGTAMNKMLVNAGKTPQLFSDLGVAIVRTKDGAVDANGTFEAVIDHLKGITDPAQRAVEGTKLLGKQWKEISPLIDEGSASLQKLEDSTPKGLIFHDEDVTTAKDMKASFKDLEDAGQSLAMELGKAVVPALTNVAKTGVTVVQVLDKTFEDLQKIDGNTAGANFAAKLQKNLEDAKKQVYGNMQDIVDKMFEGFTLTGEVALSAVDPVEHLGKATDDLLAPVESTAEAMKRMQAAAALVNDSLKSQISALGTDKDALEGMAAAGQAAADAQQDLSKASDDWTAYLSTEQAQIDDVNKSTGTAAEKQAKLNDIYRDGVDKAKAIADGWVASKTALDAQNGTVTTAAQKLDIQNAAMLTAASTAKGPLQQSILDYIGTLNGIPPEKVAEIKADLDRGDIDAANAALADTSRTRQADIVAHDDENAIALAKAQLDYLARDRTVNVFVKPHGGTVTVGPNGEVTGLAGGGDTVKGGLYEVTEGGKSELLHENGKTYLMSGADGAVEPLGSGIGTTAAPVSAGGTGDTHVHVGGITVHAGMGSNGMQIGQQAAMAIQEALLGLARTQGAVWQRVGGR